MDDPPGLVEKPGGGAWVEGWGWDPMEHVGRLSWGEAVPGSFQLWVGVSFHSLAAPALGSRIWGSPPSDSVKACPASLGLPSYQSHARTWKFGGGVVYSEWSLGFRWHALTLDG